MKHQKNMIRKQVYIVNEGVSLCPRGSFLYGRMIR